MKAVPVIALCASRTAPVDGAPFGAATVSEAYVEAVRAAGGLPVIVPQQVSEDHLADLFPRLDGVVFIGGGDIDPRRFQGQPHPRVYGIEPARDALEIRLVQMAAEQGKPFLGICRGLQVINVALGGTLFTDIADQLPGAQRHDWFPDIPRDYLAHSVQVAPGSRLQQILGGAEQPVNSLHHQGIQDPAPALTVSAYAPDGLAEAVELSGHPFGIGVQWHPEWLQAHEPQRRLFQALIEAARQPA